MVGKRSSMRSRMRRIGRRRKRRRHGVGNAELIQEQSFQDIYCDSDEYFKTCFTNLSKDYHAVSTEQKNEIEDKFVILDKVYQYESEAELENLMRTKLAEIYSKLKEKCKIELFEFENFGLLPTSHYIQYVQLYEEKEDPVIKICVTVQRNFSVRICVNTKLLPEYHTLWSVLPDSCNTTVKLRKVLNAISVFSVCPGNPDSTYTTLHDKYMHRNKSVTAGYFDDIGYQTIRASNCVLLIKNPRCYNCCLHRKTLNKILSRKQTRVDRPKKNLIRSTNENARMRSSQNIENLLHLHNYALPRESEVERPRKKVKINNLLKMIA